MSDTWILDPNATLDFEFDWSPWLQDGETIQSQTVTGVGVTVDSTVRTGGVVTVWLSGGSLTTRDASVACRITTSQGRTDERTKPIVITER